MFEFLEDLKTYIQNGFSTDTSIPTSKKPNVFNGYSVGHEPNKTTPEIQITIMNNSEQNEFTTFCNKNAENIPVQISAITGQMKINNVDRNAQNASMILGDKVRDLVFQYIYSNTNVNIYNCRYVSTSPALPLNDSGSVYMTALRFTFVIAYPYVTGA